MTKQDFLTRLGERLSGLPEQDALERVNFYGEMIDDRMEDGLSEEEAVTEIGNIDEVVSQILADYPLAKLVKENIKPRRKLKTWEIVVLAAGSPIWLSLLIAALAVALSLYIVLWALVLVIWAIDLLLAAGVLCGVAAAVACFSQGLTSEGLASTGLGLFCAGLAIFLFFGCLAATKGSARLTKKIILGIKNLIIKRRERNE